MLTSRGMVCGYCVKAQTMQEAVAELYGFATVAQPVDSEKVQ